MTPRRFRITYWLGQVLHVYTISASNGEAACRYVPATAEDLKVREIEQ